MTTIKDIINNATNYVATEMAEFTIEGETFAGYSEYKFMWEVTLSKQLDRASNGNMGNLDTYPAFATPHATIRYDFMPITDYRRLRQLYLNETAEGFLPRKHFTATVYDSDYDRKITTDMYLATPSMPEYYTNTTDDGEVELLGVRNYTIELIGTNNEVDE